MTHKEAIQYLGEKDHDIADDYAWREAARKKAEAEAKKKREEELLSSIARELEIVRENVTMSKGVSQ
jgi:hypothetical protein